MPTSSILVPVHREPRPERPPRRGEGAHGLKGRIQKVLDHPVDRQLPVHPVPQPSVHKDPLPGPPSAVYPFAVEVQPLDPRPQTVPVPPSPPSPPACAAHTRPGAPPPHRSCVGESPRASPGGASRAAPGPPRWHPGPSPRGGSGAAGGQEQRPMHCARTRQRAREPRSSVARSTRSLDKRFGSAPTTTAPARPVRRTPSSNASALLRRAAAQSEAPHRARRPTALQVHVRQAPERVRHRRRPSALQLRVGPHRLARRRTRSAHHRRRLGPHPPRLRQYPQPAYTPRECKGRNTCTYTPMVKRARSGSASVRSQATAVS
jgi:hypothetical protein